MDIKKWLLGFGDSSFLKRPYKISRLLFLFYSLLVVGFVAFLYTTSSVYIYSECPSSTTDRCFNSAFNSSVCLKNDLMSLPVCSQEEIFIDPITKKGSLGEKPPWYFANYTTIVLGGYLFMLLINTLLFNRHLFSKPKEGETIYNVENFLFMEKKGIIKIGSDGLPVVENVKEDNNKVENVEGSGSDSIVHQSNDSERVSSGSKPEVKPSKESSVEAIVESDEKPIGNKSDRRFRKRDNSNGVQ